MSKIVKLAIVGGLALAPLSAARADVVYNLSTVTLSTLVAGGAAVGNLTGSFTTNDARSTVISFNIQASAAGSFAGFAYTPSNSTVSASSLPSQYFQLDSTGSINELRLYFSSPLTATGATLSTASSYEHEPSGGNRFPTGSVAVATAAAVPEPASLVTLAAGLIGLAAIRRRKPS